MNLTIKANHMKNLVIPLIFLILLTGCGPELLIAPIINGLVYWMEGEAHKYYAFDSDILHHAAKRACFDLQYTIHSDETDPDGNHLIIAGQNNRFKIKIEQADKNINAIKIRINL